MRFRPLQKKLVPLAKCRNLDIKFFRENESGAKLKPTKFNSDNSHLSK